MRSADGDRGISRFLHFDESPQRARARVGNVDDGDGSRGDFELFIEVDHFDVGAPLRRNIERRKNFFDPAFDRRRIAALAEALRQHDGILTAERTQIAPHEAPDGFLGGIASGKLGDEPHVGGAFVALARPLLSRCIEFWFR